MLRRSPIVLLFGLLASAASAAEPVRHAFLAMGGATFITDEAGKAVWKYAQSSRDGWVLENGHVLLALSKNKICPGGAVGEVDREGKLLLEFNGTQDGVNAVQPLPEGLV